MMTATRADVAHRAGVSPALVSYVLNDGPRPVSAAARARILQAIEELDYRPNSVARSLRLGSAHTIGLIVPDNANPFIAELSRALERELYLTEHMLLLGNALDDAQRQAQYVRSFLDQQVDGLIVVPSAGTGNEWLDDIKNTRIPLVVIGRRLTRLSVSSVLVDSFQGAKTAVLHLVQQHHKRRIGCLAGPQTLHSTGLRNQGWAAALEDSGIDPTSLPIAHSDTNRRAAHTAALQLLNDNDLDGLFVTSDEQALGVIRAAGELGLCIPDDLALVSFDGIADGQFTTPTLTTMRQPLDDIAKAASDLILNHRETTSHRVLSTELVLGESCGCISRPGVHHES